MYGCTDCVLKLEYETQNATINVVSSLLLTLWHLETGDRLNCTAPWRVNLVEHNNPQDMSSFHVQVRHLIY